jgi:thiol-disulfide isomerase/thioredoxin
MSLAYSSMLPLGTVAPDFRFPDVISGKTLSLQELRSSQGTVIMFICNHCPYVKHILPKLIEISKIYQQKHILFIAINSNDINNYPDDSPENMKKAAKQWGFTFPYLFDDSQEIAKAYQAECTPDFYLFDKDLRCVYRGRFDDASPGNHHVVTGKDLSEAIDNLLANKPINSEQFSSMGCSIKWKK